MEAAEKVASRMSVLHQVLDILPLNEEKRRFQRVRVNLLGRYMLADRRGAFTVYEGGRR